MQQVEIRVKGRIDKNWSRWFGGFNISYNPREESVLEGHVRDQAELRGILSRLADLGLELIAVTTDPVFFRAGGDGQTKSKTNKVQDTRKIK